MVFVGEKVNHKNAYATKAVESVVVIAPAKKEDGLKEKLYKLDRDEQIALLKARGVSDAQLKELKREADRVDKLLELEG